MNCSIWETEYVLHTFLGILMEAWGLGVCPQSNVINIISLKIYVYRKTANLHHFSLGGFHNIKTSTSTSFLIYIIFDIHHFRYTQK